jgi:putative lipoprotein
MKVIGITLAILISLLLLASCARPASVKGTLNTQEQVELPAGATVNVQLQDVSRADAPAIVLGEQIIENPEQFPIPFEIMYDPAQIDERHTYSMRVRIEVEGKLIFINTTAHHVITRGNPTELEVIVDKVIPYVQPGVSATLEDTTWILASYGETGNLKAVLEDTEITAEFVSAEKSVKGSAGCNSYFGVYEINGNKLSMREIANTEMACLTPKGIMEQEQHYLNLLRAAKSYQIQEGKLQITSGAEILVYSVK